MSKHTCHARGCTAEVPPKMLMCRKHWSMVPQAIQRRVWAHYNEGQEKTGRASRKWIDAAREALEAVAEKEEAALEKQKSPRVVDRITIHPALCECEWCNDDPFSPVRASAPKHYPPANTHGSDTEEGARCRSCNAAVVWAHTEKGKAMPLDPEPRPDGNIRMQTEAGEQIAYYDKKSETESLFDTGPRYVSHFATCPESREWRKEGAPEVKPRAAKRGAE